MAAVMPAVAPWTFPNEYMHGPAAAGPTTTAVSTAAPHPPRRWTEYPEVRPTAMPTARHPAKRQKLHLNLTSTVRGYSWARHAVTPARTPVTIAIPTPRATPTRGLNFTAAAKPDAAPRSKP